jgi:hypothetical protein
MKPLEGDGGFFQSIALDLAKIMFVECEEVD